MEELNTQYVKRTQKDYSLTFKFAVVKEIKRGFTTKTDAMPRPAIALHRTRK